MCCYAVGSGLALSSWLGSVMIRSSGTPKGWPSVALAGGCWGVEIGDRGGELFFGKLLLIGDNTR